MANSNPSNFKVLIHPEDYLKRLELDEEPPTLKYLNKLHRQHLLKIPFENLDIHYHKRIELKVDSIFHKVMNNRGGFCYELNGIFLHLLKSLGFNCWYASAEVKNEDGWSNDFDHMIIIVNVEGQHYLVDVGFGDLIIQPKKIILNTPQVDYTRYFRFDHDPDSRWVLKESSDNSQYKPKYRFTTEEKGFIQFLEGCNYHQDSPASPFTQNKFITQLFPNGRISLTTRKLKLMLDGEIEQMDISNEDEFLAKLENHFGIDSRRLSLQSLE
ncbi:MAG: N-hydroxyarylamine O-acetyltransferase [Cyclobacteriaceae bacterium]|jgi:N-hydroxyarylamine O-acetyltransferase